MKVLANDGISPEGIEKLEQAGITVVTDKVDQDKLADAINKEDYKALLVRSATTVRKELIDQCPGLKFIGRGGVGMDNIDVSYARSKGIIVENTPEASSQSVAELVMGALFSVARSTFDSYKEMPDNGAENFKKLKKKYGEGIELRGKTLLIVGFGRIGQSLAGYALGVGMKVKAVDHSSFKIDIPVTIEGIGTVNSSIETDTDMNAALPHADFISLHIPKQEGGKPVITSKEIAQMKEGVRIVNAARGGVIDENDLLKALDEGKIAAAALDVFENEPTPKKELLAHPAIACTPHIGAATVEAQGRIGVELADKIIATLK
ncbi:MAG: D-2-hydroxyacid dehydrogenase [Brumimicrobium sp.]|nr:D-2-hydroxyacid dehydrogenase [Brumimicrobium sp.]